MAATSIPSSAGASVKVIISTCRCRGGPGLSVDQVHAVSLRQTGSLYWHLGLFWLRKISSWLGRANPRSQHPVWIWELGRADAFALPNCLRQLEQGEVGLWGGVSAMDLDSRIERGGHRMTWEGLLPGALTWELFEQDVHVLCASASSSSKRRCWASGLVALTRSLKWLTSVLSLAVTLCSHARWTTEFDSYCWMNIQTFLSALFYLEEKLPPCYLCFLFGVTKKIWEERLWKMDPFGLLSRFAVWFFFPLTLFLLARRVWFSWKSRLTVQMLIIFIGHDL